MECVAIVQPAAVPIRVMWQLGRDRRHVPAGLEYLRGCRLGMGWEGQSRGYAMNSLHTVPCHIAGMGALSYWKRKLFPTFGAIGRTCG